ncbi:MAG TPA: MFS transporter [Roseomonas sp.]|jgi:MFS family permease
MILSLLLNRSFRAFLVANALERFAASAMTVLLGLQVYELTRNPLDLGWLGLAEALPGISLVLYGGHVADRHSRRGIMLLTLALLAVLAGGLALLTGSSLGGLGLILVVAFLSGAVRAFESPAASGLEAQVVPINHLMRGVSLLATTGRLADVVGPMAGGFAWVWLGAEGTYAAIAVLFALACLTTVFVGRDRPAAPLAAADDEGTRARIVAGIRYVFGSQLLLGSMALDLFAVFFGGATALMPAIATDVLHAGPTALGLLRSAASAGALLAALVAVRFVSPRRAGWVLHGVIAGFGVSMVLLGLSHSLLLSLVALFISGLCDGTSMIIRRAILRLASPEALRGRISAVRMVFVGSSNELGALESGIAASLLGTGAAIWAGGIATLAIVGVTALAAPKLRRLDLDAMARAEARTPDRA